MSIAKPIPHQLVALLKKTGHRANGVATVAEARTLFEDDAPDLSATDAVLIGGSSDTLIQQAEAVGAKILVMTGSAERIVELDGAGQPMDLLTVRYDNTRQAAVSGPSGATPANNLRCHSAVI